MYEVKEVRTGSCNSAQAHFYHDTADVANNVAVCANMAINKGS